MKKGDLFLISEEILKSTELVGDIYYLIYESGLSDRERVKHYFHLFDSKGRTTVIFTENEVSELIRIGAWIKCSEDQIAKFFMLYGDKYENY